jgi:hypothetical protein
MTDLSDRVNQELERVAAQREEILEAFIAKYGCGPDDLVQVEQRTEDGCRWWVERTPPPPTPPAPCELGVQPPSVYLAYCALARRVAVADAILRCGGDAVSKLTILEAEMAAAMQVIHEYETTSLIIND